ncbi:hypothetical protein STIAU_7074 [Stigmatella aurantiaca DW4/3-1]|uniref:Uncharacterized protein n=1 Tax=Stigmatella aurantiaca (strain DW4/3-1) TaxID=378806 RepID=Q095A7_STIAD|nr:hypothetical protein STIAU_7074 [Stigmatella aurantiaca DW4/3-1]
MLTPCIGSTCDGRGGHSQHRGVLLAALRVVAPQERHLPVDEVDEDGALLLRVGTHEASEALDGASTRAAGVRQEDAREARQVEPLVRQAGGHQHADAPGTGLVQEGLARFARHLARQRGGRQAGGREPMRQQLAVVHPAREDEAQVACPRFAGHGPEDEVIAHLVLRQRLQHGRVVRGAEVGEVEGRLHGAHLGHHQHAARDEVLVLHHSQGRAQVQAQERRQPVLSLGRCRQAQPVARRAAVDDSVEGTRGDVVGLVEDEQSEALEKGVELRLVPPGQGLDDGHGDGPHLLFPRAHEACLQAQALAHVLSPLLRQIQGVDEDERRRAQARDGPHGEDALPCPAWEHRNPLGGLRQALHGLGLVVAQRHHRQLRQALGRQHPRVLEGQRQARLVRGPAQQVNGPARQHQLPLLLAEEVQRLGLRTGALAQPHQLQIGGVGKGEGPAEALQHLGRHVAHREPQPSVHPHAQRPRAHARVVRRRGRRVPHAGVLGARGNTSPVPVHFGEVFHHSCRPQ